MYAQNCKIKYFNEQKLPPQIHNTFTCSTHTPTCACRHAQVGVHLFGGQATWNFSPLKHTKNYNENASE